MILNEITDFALSIYFCGLRVYLGGYAEHLPKHLFEKLIIACYGDDVFTDPAISIIEIDGIPYYLNERYPSYKREVLEFLTSMCIFRIEEGKVFLQTRIKLFYLSVPATDLYCGAEAEREKSWSYFCSEHYKYGPKRIEKIKEIIDEEHKNLKTPFVRWNLLFQMYFNWNLTIEG